MKVNEYFDKVFYINSKTRIDRYRNMIDRLPKLGIEAERFEAILGGQLIAKEFDFGDSKKNLNNAEIGCFQSHRAIYKKAIENNYEAVFILEDDALFCENFNEIFAEQIKNVPDDWQMLYFGQFNYDEIGTISGSKTQAIKENISGKIYRAERCWLTHAYAIRGCAQYLYDNTKVMYHTFDAVLADLQNDLKVYAFHPNIIRQDDTASSIRPNLKLQK